jgi:glycosyltransferase involved in cell wall biosynthesis
MKKIGLLSVIFSFYNEENVLPELISRTKNTLTNLVEKKLIDDYEIIFVNDDSNDKSEIIIREELKKSKIVLINMSRNFGTSECVIAGFKQSKGDAVVYMDSDLQDPPELIENLILLGYENKNAEVIYTTRLKRNGESWFKLFLIKYGYRLINLISDIPLAVDSGDFKLLSRTVIDHIISLKEANPYLRGMVAWVGFRQIPFYYERDARFDGAENTKVKVLSRKNLSYWLDRALISFSDAPLKIVFFLGSFTILISVLIFLYAIYQKFLGISIPGWAAIVVLISFMSGVQLLVLAIFGLYIGAIFRESKGRPLYIIKEIIK